MAAVPSLSAGEILGDPHSKSRKIFQKVNHPVLGEKTVVRPPWLMSETPALVRTPAPLLGANNEEIFNGLLGMSKEETEALEEQKIIY